MKSSKRRHKYCLKQTKKETGPVSAHLERALFLNSFPGLLVVLVDFFVAEDPALCSGKRPHKHVEYFSTGEREFFLPTTLIKVLGGGGEDKRTHGFIGPRLKHTCKADENTRGKASHTSRSGADAAGMMKSC